VAQGARVNCVFSLIHHRVAYDVGAQECVSHGLVNELPVRFVKSGEIAAQVQFTVLVTDAKTVQLNGLAPPAVQSAFSITDPELQRILALNPKTGVSDL
jgi:hypothetical protein